MRNKQDCKNGQQKLAELLKTYHYATGIAIALVDPQGNTVLSEGNPDNFCNLYNRLAKQECNCKKRHLEACLTSIRTGVPYFFFCNLDLAHIAIPLSDQDSFCGGIIVGPLIIDSKESPFDKEEILRPLAGMLGCRQLRAELENIPITDPLRAQYLSNILFILASQEVERFYAYMRLHRRKTLLQAQMLEQISFYKTAEAPSYHYQTIQKNLFQHMRNGHAVEAKAALNELISLACLNNEEDLPIIQVRAMAISTLLTHAATECGADAKVMLRVNQTFFSDLQGLRHKNDLCKWMFSALDYYINQIIALQVQQQSDSIRKAIAYIQEHYQENLTAEQVTRHVHLNPSYFSTLFKKETGLTFSRYLLQYRIATSKLLLSNSGLSMLEIAQSVGLNSQSYFTKVFKQETGLTPSAYRKKITSNTPPLKQKILQ